MVAQLESKGISSRISHTGSVSLASMAGRYAQCLIAKIVVHEPEHDCAGVSLVFLLEGMGNRVKRRIPILTLPFCRST